MWDHEGGYKEESDQICTTHSTTCPRRYQVIAYGEIPTQYQRYLFHLLRKTNKNSPICRLNVLMTKILHKKRAAARTVS